MYSVSQRSTGAPLDRQHTTQEMALHTKFIGDIFEYYELVIKINRFSRTSTCFYYHYDLKVFNNFIAN